MTSELIAYEERLYHTMMRDRVIMDLVFGTDTDKRNLHDRLTRIKVNPYYTFPTVAIFDYTSRSTATSRMDHNDSQLVKQRMRHHLERLAPEGAAVFMDEQGRVGLLFSWITTGLIEDLQLQLSDRLHVPITAGVGRPCSRLTEAGESFQQAEQALRHKFYLGEGRVIHYRDLEPYRQLNEYPIYKEKELFDRVKNAESKERIAVEVREFYTGLLKNGLIDIRHMYELTIRLLAGIEKRMLSDTKNAGAHMRHEIMSITSMDTLAELERFVCDYVTDMKAEVEKHEKENHRSIIQKTIFYMEKECQYATLDSVAKKVYMTPTYLSMLFKVNTGKTFIEQLTDIRINKAKEMLRSTYMKNYEVAEQVGYRDSRYFSQIFKKKVGLSPSEYREAANR